jgi:hypothetical protein
MFTNPQVRDEASQELSDEMPKEIEKNEENEPNS